MAQEIDPDKFISCSCLGSLEFCSIVVPWHDLYLGWGSFTPLFTRMDLLKLVLKELEIGTHDILPSNSYNLPPDVSQFWCRSASCNGECENRTWNVNGRSVDLDKGKATNELVCYTAENPFHVRLIGPNRRPEMEARFARKRVKFPLQNAGKDGESSLAQHECPNKPLRKNGKITVTTATKLMPDGKRRRRSSAHLMQPINLESSG
ncbi:Condensin-2 complex subunit H2 [Zea mays]|uniref:Condensin-2 complex subunit H2 n=1 Tax=Zea mays TaxID=4577 RepID=A0A1D6JUA5_MAIZE|nr:Condensin-2 complex subunit H2 [Zea mays]ONL95401.1 Condensin-2 complex subunit H2 [Zea mays]